MQRFENVLQQCACQGDSWSAAVFQTGREPVIHHDVQRPVVSYTQDENKD